MNKLRLQIDPGQPGVSAMRLTKQTNYAIGMLMFCAAREAGLSRVQDVAKAYAEKHGIAARIHATPPKTLKLQAYADNFR